MLIELPPVLGPMGRIRDSPATSPGSVSQAVIQDPLQPRTLYQALLSKICALETAGVLVVLPQTPQTQILMTFSIASPSPFHLRITGLIGK